MRTSEIVEALGDPVIRLEVIVALRKMGYEVELR